MKIIFLLLFKNGEHMANIFDDLEVGKSVFKDKQPLDHRFLS